MENGSYDAFGVAMFKDWLNARIAAIRNLKSTDSLNSQIETIPTEELIHLWNGIEILSDVLGMEMREEYDKGRYYYHCFYDGVKIIQVSDRRLVEGK